MEFKKLFVAAALLLLLNPTISLAQVDWSTKLFSIFFGKLPRACAREITPQCLSCLTYVKILPLLFFIALFFLIFYYVVLAATRPPVLPLPGYPIPPPPPLGAMETKAIAILSLILALILINILPLETILAQLRIWVAILIFVVCLLLVRSIIKLGGFPGFLIALIVGIIIFSIFWSFIAGTAGKFEELVRLCL